MKHIKQYENVITLKRYAIWHQPDKPTEIIHITKKDIKYDLIKSKTLFKLYDDRIVAVKSIEESFSNDGAKKFIIFSSDDLQECINILPIIVNTIKYNI